MSFQLDLNWHPPISESYWWKWKSLSLVPLYVTSMTTVHGILQARILEWVGFPFSRESSQPRDQTQVSHIVGRVFTSWVTREAQELLVQFSSVTQSCPTLCDPMDYSTPDLPVHHKLLEPTQTHVHRVGDAIQPSHPLSSPSPPAPNPCQHQGLFKWVSSSHHWPKYWSFSFNISPPNEHSGLIFRKDRLDLLAVQETLKSLLHQLSFFGQVILLYDDNLWKKSKSCPVVSVSSRFLI